MENTNHLVVSNQEEFFVDYEIALELEKLGFDEKCLATIDNYRYLHINGTRRPPGGAVCVEVCKCPLISQVIAWFRKKHFIYGEVYPFCDKWSIQIHCLKDLGSCFTGYPDMEYDTYEQAEKSLIKEIINIYGKIK